MRHIWRHRRTGGDGGHETLGHALLVTVAAGGILLAARVSNVAVTAFQSLQFPHG